MGGYRRLLSNEFDHSEYFHMITGRQTNGHVAVLFLQHSVGKSDSHAQIDPILIQELRHGKKDGAQTIVTLRRQLPRCYIPRFLHKVERQFGYTRVRLKDSVEDLRHAFVAAGQDMPPVTKSFLSRLRLSNPIHNMSFF